MLACAMAGTLCAQQADAEFKRGMAQLYKNWMQGHVFTVGYEVHARTTAGGVTLGENRWEERITLDAATKRFIWEQHYWPEHGQQGVYRFTRWDGRELINGGTIVPRAIQKGGQAVTTLADAPVGIPLCTAVRRQEMLKIDSFALSSDAVMQAAGFGLDDKPTELRLEELLRDPLARLEHAAGTGPDDLTLMVKNQSVIFDARQGVIKETYGFGGPKVWRVVHRFADHLPLDVTITVDFADGREQTKMEYKAFEDQCRVMSTAEFEQLIKAPMPPDVVIRQPQALHPF